MGAGTSASEHLNTEDLAMDAHGEKSPGTPWSPAELTSMKPKEGERRRGLVTEAAGTEGDALELRPAPSVFSAHKKCANLKYFRKKAGGKGAARARDISSKVGTQKAGTPSTSAALQITEAVFGVNPATGLKTLEVRPAVKPQSPPR